MDGFFQSRNLEYEELLLRNQIITSEEERNLEKWPMTSSDVDKMTSSTLITQPYNYTSNLERYLYALWSLRLETNRDDWRAMLQAKRKMEYEALIGKRERGL